VLLLKLVFNLELYFSNMSVSQFTHEGTTYKFEPPIDTKTRTIKDLAELVAIAQHGAGIGEGELRIATLSAQLVMKHSESDQLSTLNSMLQGKHQVTIAK
jgi:hypothetical protein